MRCMTSWESTRNTADSHRDEQGHQRHCIRRLRGHLRRQNDGGSPFRLQLRKMLPHRALLPAGEYGQEVRHEEEGGRDRQDVEEVRRLHQR
ncbi:hypothetical protein TB1_038171 [Malus domestica]